MDGATSKLDLERSRRSQSSGVLNSESPVDSSWLDFDSEVVDGFAPPAGSALRHSRPVSLGQPLEPGLRKEDVGVQGSSGAPNNAAGDAIQDRLSTDDGQPSRMAGVPTAVESPVVRTSTSKLPPQDLDRSNPAFHPHTDAHGTSRPRRTESMASMSIMTSPNRDSSADLRPAHPYALYPQNALFEAGGTDDTTQQTIPVGFTGINRQYERRIGPDGEEQDIVGPDGHAEQLPPYSRFPDSRPAAVSSPNSSLSPSTSPAERVVTMSQDTLALSRDASGPHASTSNIIAPASGEHNVVSEKRWREKNWREKGETRVCGRKIPLWFILLVILMAVLLLTIGSYFGIKSRSKHGDDEDVDVDEDEDSALSDDSPRSFRDATSIPRPTDIPSLRAGLYSLPNILPEESQASCLADAGQANAWSCDVTGPPAELQIVRGTGSSDEIRIVTADESVPIHYGMQTPQTALQEMTLVIDLDEKASGPAYYFQSTYDKLIVLREDEFPMIALARRDAAPEALPNPPGPRPGFELEVGDVAWFCYWNDTFIAGFIYAFQDTVDISLVSDSEPTATDSSASSATDSEIGISNASPQATESIIPLVNREAAPLDSSADFSNTGQAEAPRLVSRSAPPEFYKAIKIEERHSPSNEFRPYCQKMRVDLDETIVSVLNEDGTDIIVLLGEEPTGEESNKVKRSSPNGSPLQKREEAVDSCFCQWASR